MNGSEDLGMHMNGPSSSGNTFVVRIWRERSHESSAWRGQIEHIAYGNKEGFLFLEEMVRFIQIYVEMPIMGPESKGGKQEEIRR